MSTRKATDDEIREAYERTKSAKATARQFGMAATSVGERLERMGIKRVHATSTLIKGEPGDDFALQWVKEKVDPDAREQYLRDLASELSRSIPRQASIRPPKITALHLCNLYTITDYHMGMLAWGQETGADWDLKIAERLLQGVFTHMVESSPPARVGVVNQMGDFNHTDGLIPETPAHKHVLDADGRFPKIVAATTRSTRMMINTALRRHEEVHVKLAEGNHDPASSVWLREMFTALYENEPRVTIDKSPLPYYAYQHGKTMLAFHHGHLKKNESLPLLFAALFPQMWGSTTKRYCHTGHRHHTEEKEHAGMTVHQHPTLAARDAHAARGGWLSERQASSITYHSEYGQVARNVVTPEMMDAA